MIRTCNLQGTRLVTLSACDSGLGEPPPGEGVMGLGRAFMLAGAESVLLSLSPVRDQTTVKWMEIFYRSLLHDGLSRGAALHAAQMKLRSERATQMPSFWGSFVLYGASGPL